MTTYLVTGCTRGVGLAMTKALLERGDRVFGSIRGGEAPIAHERFHPVTFDVRSKDAIDSAAVNVDVPIDVLVNNAGVLGPASPSTLEIDFAGFADAVDVNVLGSLRVVHAFLPHLRRSKGAKVMTLSTQMAGTTAPGSDCMAYRASKAALNKVMHGLAADLAKENIAVVTVHPGWVRTDMGGPQAELDPTESAAGLIGVADRLSLETTGRFVNWDGSERAW